MDKNSEDKINTDPEFREKVIQTLLDGAFYFIYDDAIYLLQQHTYVYPGVYRIAPKETEFKKIPQDGPIFNYDVILSGRDKGYSRISYMYLTKLSNKEPKYDENLVLIIAKLLKNYVSSAISNSPRAAKLKDDLTLAELRTLRFMNTSYYKSAKADEERKRGIYNTYLKIAVLPDITIYGKIAYIRENIPGLSYDAIIKIMEDLGL